MHVYTRVLLLTLIAFGLNASDARSQLKYSIKPKQVVPYRVTITADTSASVQTMKGIIAFTGKQVEGKNLTVTYLGGLTKSTKAKGSTGTRTRFRGRPGGGPPRSPFDQPDFRGLTQTSNTIVLSDVGSIESMKGDSQLPFLLGNLSAMPFDPLPSGNKKEWEDGNGLTITSSDSNSRSRFGGRGPFSNNNQDESKKGGGEIARFKITQDNGKLVTISKNYSLTSPAATSKETGFEMKGSGTWVFNKELGVSESMEYKATMTVQSENSTTRYPLTVAWTRMPVDEYEAFVKETKERRDAAIAKAKNPTKPVKFSDRDKTRIMGRLQNKNTGTVWVELENLNRSRMSGLVKDDMDLLTLVGTLRASSTSRVKKSADKVWKKWGESFEKYASAKQKAQVIAAVGEGADMADTGGDDNPFSVEGDDDGKGMRKWKSGRFEIEAEFQKVDGRMVVLKNKAGRTVRVPVSRLSDADKAVVEKLTGK